MRALVVEDDLADQIIIRKYLEDLGHAVIICPDGNRAVELYRSKSFDLVSMDITLEGADGFEITREMRFMHNPVV